MTGATVINHIFPTVVHCYTFRIGTLLSFPPSHRMALLVILYPDKYFILIRYPPITLLY